MQNYLRDVEQRLDELEQQVGRLRQHLGVLPGQQPPASELALDAMLDQFLESMGITGELSGLAQLRALQAQQEQRWAKRRRNGAPAHRPSRP